MVRTVHTADVVPQVWMVRPGVVTAFDAAEGAGWLVDSVDGTRWWFHCTRIADGSRQVANGATGSFRVTTGPTGLEATDVLPRPVATD